MRRRIAALAGLVALAATLAVWLAVAPITFAGDPCYHGFTMPDDSVGSDAEIKLMPCAFSPTITSVGVGAKVTFYNGLDFTHLITGANQSWGSRDVELAPGKTVSYQFDKAGVYPYACALHRGMSGVIIVGDAATAVAGAKGAASGAGTTTGSGSGSPASGSSEIGSGATAASTTPVIEPVALAGLSAAAGTIVGAGVAWFALRRRSTGDKEQLAGMA
jgi:plastocyanin